VILLALLLTPLSFAQSIEKDKAAAQQEVQNLQQKLESSVERYNYACVQLEETRVQISEKKAELKKANLKLAAARKVLNSRVREMYVIGQSKFVDVVVNAKSFSDFLVGLDFEKTVGQRDAQIINKVKSAKSRLEAINTSLQEKEAAQIQARKEIADAKATVESDLAGAKGKLANIEVQEQQIKQAMARAAAEAAANNAALAAARSRVPSSATNHTGLPSAVTRVAPPSVPPGTPRTGVVSVAYAQLGKPYEWGAAGPDSFDCSGLVMYCYAVGEGIDLPHSSYAQADCGTPVGVSELQPGDILGFRGWGHVGLYVGGGNFIQAPCTGDVVKITSLSSRGDFCGAVRP
jgi:peptidoglycan DL-endopeptidase CwlO